jgi:hypothetical protein
MTPKRRAPFNASSMSQWRSMDPGIATQLITVGATLGGVVLTLGTNAYLERRRVRDTRELESLRIASEHATWLRNERLKAYSGLSMAGEEVQQFVRYELPKLIEPDHAERRDDTEAHWHELRIELRKAYNHVALFGAEDVRAAALHLWRTARNGVSDILHDLDANPDSSGRRTDLSEQTRAVASRLGSAGNSFLEACRKDLQG